MKGKPIPRLMRTDPCCTRHLDNQSKLDGFCSELAEHFVQTCIVFMLGAVTQTGSIDLGHHNLDKQLIKWSIVGLPIITIKDQGKLFKKNKIFYFIMKGIITRCENILSDHNNDPICTFNNKSVTVNLKLQSFFLIFCIKHIF